MSNSFQAEPKRHPDGATEGRAARSPGQGLMASAKRKVVEHLEAHGPCHVADIPPSWPITRTIVRWAVRELVSEGVARWVGFRNPRRVTLTAAALRARAR